MTVGDWVVLIGLLANVAAVVYGVQRTNKNIAVIHDLVNGHMTELLEKVDELGIAKGRKQVQDEKGAAP